MEVKPKPEEFNPQEQALLYSVLPHSLLQQYQPNPLQNNPFIFLSSPPRNVVYNNIVVNNNLNNNNDIVVTNTNNLHNNNNNNNNVVYNGTVVNNNNNNNVVVVDSRVTNDDSTINDIVFIDDVSKEDEEYIKEFPPGFRFKPHDVELILYYLTNKVLKLPLPPNKIRSVDIYLHNPEDLIAKLTENSVGQFENEWYFFTPRKRKYRNGTRPNRRAGQEDRIGYWKATGADKSIEDRGAIVGFRKALVFYNGKAPSGLKTNWIMHEYRMNIPPLNKMNAEDMRLDDWVLCKLHKKLYKAARIAQDDGEPQLGIVDNEFLPQDHDNCFNQYENGNSDELMFDPAMLPIHYGDDYNPFVSTIDPRFTSNQTGIQSNQHPIG